MNATRAAPYAAQWALAELEASSLVGLWGREGRRSGVELEGVIGEMRELFTLREV